MLKSSMLGTEINNAQITDLANEYDDNGGVLTDASIVAGVDTTIVATALDTNVLYIAVTGNGGADDTLTVQVQNVTTDGGAANSADLVISTLADTGNLISGAAAQEAFGIDTDAGGLNIKDTAGFKYPLKVTVADELGNAHTFTDIDTRTFAATAVYYSTGAIGYFANTAANDDLILTEAGYIANLTTNAALTDVSIDQTAQTTVTLGATAVDAVAITTGQTRTPKGFEYMLKSNMLGTEVNVAQITNLVDAYDDNGGTLTDATITVGGGATLVASAASSDVLYIAITGNAGDDDAFTVQLQNVTADGGTANIADLVRSTITDDGGTNIINAAAAQATFEIDTNATTTLKNTTGFQYPLKITTADELATAMNIADLDAKTYDTTAPYYSATNVAYYGNTGASKAVDLQEDGYVTAATTNTNLAASVTTDQTAQTTITLDTSAASAAAISAGDTVNIKGMEYAAKVTVTREGDGAAVSSATVTSGDSYGVSCSESGSTGVYYCIIPTSHTDNVGKITIANYAEKLIYYTDRTANADAQGVLTATLEVQLDTTAPTVSSTVPDHTGAQTDIAVATSPTVTFDSAVHPNSVNSNSVCITTSSSAANECASSISATVTLNADNTEATIDPVANLGYNTAYYLHVTTDVTDQAGNNIAANFVGSNSFTTVTTDTTPPTITTPVPADAAVDVAVGTTVTVTMSEALDATTVNTNTVKLYLDIGTANQVDVGTDTEVEAIVSLENNGASTKIYIAPVANLGYSGNYIYRISTGIQDSAGNALAANGDYDFTTAADTSDATDPTVNAQTPVDGAVDQAIAVSPTVTFDEAMDTTTVNTNTVQLKAYTDDSIINTTVTYNTATDVATIDPIASLSYNTQYYVWVSGAKDSAGNTVTAYTTKADQDFTTLADPDSTAPTITTPVPADAAVDVAVGTTVTVTMSEALDATTVNTNTVKLYLDIGTANQVDVGTDTEVEAIVSLENNGASTKIYIAPVANLGYSGNYIYRISTGIQDSAGNALAANGDYDFTTAADTSDATDPSISAQFPLNNATSTAITVSPTVTFDEVMDSTTLNTNTIQLKVYDTDVIVNSIITHNSTTSIATIDPVDSLSYLTQYYVWVSGAKDTAGNTVTAYTTKADQDFTTIASSADVTDPTVSAQFPLGNATSTAITVSPTVTFDEAMDATTVNANTVQLKAYSDDAIINATVIFNAGTYVATIDPIASLSYNTQYYVWVSGAKDSAGNTVTAYTTKADQDFTTLADPDSTAPTITTPVPADAAVDVAVGTTVTVTMSEALDATTVNTNTVKLYLDIGTANQVDVGTDTEVEAIVSLENNGASTKIYIAPVANLGYSGNYIYRISTGIQDSAGNALAANGDYDFTTAASTADATSPTVNAQTPVNGATSQAITVAPTITFSEAMDASTLNGGTIQLRKYSDDSLISATILYNPSTYVVILTPTANLSYNTQYYVWVSGAKDAVGNTVTAYTTKADQDFTTASQADGSLAVTNISTVKSYATADATYGNGWAWTFSITVPTSETTLKMKFDDWQSGDNTIAVADNMRFYSVQATTAINAANAIAITASGTYPTSGMTLNADLDSTTAGRQIEVSVEVKVPVGSSGGSYSTSYGILSE